MLPVVSPIPVVRAQDILDSALVGLPTLAFGNTVQPAALGLPSHLNITRSVNADHPRALQIALRTRTMSPLVKGSLVGFVSDMCLSGVGLCLSKKSRAPPSVNAKMC